jgi:hypothetical protein
MRTRILPLAGLLLLAGAPALSRAADDRPALVVSFKSLDGLITDAKYVAELAGRSEEAAQFEKMFKNQFGGPKGLEGVDPKKPIGLYVRLSPDPSTPQASEIVALAPISDEDAFVKLLKRQDALKVADKAADGSYQVTAENSPVPFFFRFANHYVYVTGATKAGIAVDRIIAPDKLLPAQTTSLAAIVLHVDAIPQSYKEVALDGAVKSLADAKKQEQPGETPAQKAFRIAAIDAAGDLVKTVINDGGDLTASIDLDQKAGQLSAQVSFSAKPGSTLAQTIADLGGKKSLGASLIGPESAANFVFDVALPQALRKSLSDAVDEAVKKGLADAPDQAQREAAQAFIKAVLPTLKAGELDGGFDLRGPGKSGLYSLVMGLKVQQGGDIEKVFRDALKTAPDNARKAIKLDVDKSGGVNIHQLIPDKNQADENVKKIFGENPEIYFAFRDDAVLIAGGADGLDALKQALAVKPTTGATIQVESSIARIAPMMVQQNPDAPAIAKKVFTEGKKDKFRIALEGGKALTVKITMDAPVVTFSAQLAEAQQKKGQ